MWIQLEVLIDNGVVFYFAKPWTWRRWREKYADHLKKFGRKKMDYGDAYILSEIHDKRLRLFKEVTPLSIEFKPLIMKRMLANELWMLGVDVEDEIKDHKKELMRIRGEIVEGTREKILGFMKMRKSEERSGKKYMKRYSEYARRCLVLLTAAILRKDGDAFPPRARNEKVVLRRLLGILKTYNESRHQGLVAALR
ncbi:MAG: hypothetical protein QXX41_13355 [Nitrososphaerota archaeon]